MRDNYFLPHLNSYFALILCFQLHFSTGYCFLRIEFTSVLLDSQQVQNADRYNNWVS